MVEATPVAEGPLQVQYSATYHRKWKVIEATVSTNETITPSGMGTLVAIAGMKKTDGTALTITNNSTYFTVTSTLSDVECVFLLTGSAGP